jgi:hypothetical protein
MDVDIGLKIDIHKKKINHPTPRNVSLMISALIDDWLFKVHQCLRSAFGVSSLFDE